MEHHEISKLLNNLALSMSATRKWTEVNDLSGSQYSITKNIKFKIPMLRLDLRDYSDTYIIIKGTITIEGTKKFF